MVNIGVPSLLFSLHYKYLLPQTVSDNECPRERERGLGADDNVAGYLR